MISFILWVFVLLLLGLASFPILFWLFPHLADRGYGLAKPAGLLIFGYLYWILVTFRIFPNNWTGVAAAYILVIMLGCFAVKQIGWQVLKNWISDNRWVVLIIETGFILLFAFFSFVRAAGPDIIGTEKPMELAFINSILHSETFPPADPWLSGYAISYYYFGYVMVAAIIRLTGTIAGVGFNLAIALWFSMAAIGSFSLVLNILSQIHIPGAEKGSSKPAITKAGWAMLGPLFLVFTANWEGLLELLHSTGVFWNSNGQSSFWKWIDIQELTTPPGLPLDWLPNRLGGIWWWRASRVLQDYDLAGNSKEIIDEFPFFSLYLADLHPHILSIPFVLLACSLAFELFQQARSGKNYTTGWFNTLKYWLIGTKPTEFSTGTIIPPTLFWSAALIFGGLSFLNTWDFPIYVGLGSAAIVLGRYLTNGWSRDRIIEFLECGFAFGIAGVVLYLPFYIGFASQAGGLLPSLAFFTRGTHLWVMFGVLLIPIFFGLLAVFQAGGLGNALISGFRKTIALVAGLWAAMLLLGLFFAFIPGIVRSINPKLEATLVSAAGMFFNLQGSSYTRDVLLDTSLKRIVSPGGWLTLVLLLTLVWGGILWYRKRNSQTAAEPDMQKAAEENDVNSLPFVFLMVAVGTGLVLFPEFFYLRDQFGWRMNTIFKFYYQAWIIWSIAASVFSFIVWNWLNKRMKWIGRAAIIISLLAGLLYPFFGFVNRFNGLNNKNLTLDGNSYYYAAYPDETTAIAFMTMAPEGIVAEAIGGSYTGFARVSTQSGQATILGWPGHESQWRGGAREIGNRESDIKLLYQTNDWQETLQILKKYQIRYIYIGSLEQSIYRVNEAKFTMNLKPAFQNNSVVIYEVPAQLLSTTPLN